MVTGGAPRILSLALLASIAAGGCGRPPAPGDWREAGDRPSDRIARLRIRTESAERVQASLELAWEDPSSDEASGCSAFLVYDRDEGLRVLARSVAFVTVFELVADRDRVWLDVPREGLTVTGARDDPDWSSLPASPDAFLIALLADPWAGREPPRPLGLSVESDSLVTGDGWILRLDPASGLPASYEREGLRIDWSDWALRRGVPWAHEAEIRTAGGLLRARLGRLLVNRAGSPGHFAFEPPEDRILESPARALERWKSALEGL